MTDDWRLQHLQTQPYLRGVIFERMAYKARRAGWDHDHCVGCWAKFAEHDSDVEPIEREGYTTTADYRNGAQYDWICLTCFADFKDAMGWTTS